jgi:hypothetical protein
MLQMVLLTLTGASLGVRGFHLGTVPPLLALGSPGKLRGDTQGLLIRVSLCCDLSALIPYILLYGVIPSQAVSNILERQCRADWRGPCPTDLV